jgi:hypothetical protein
LVSRADAYSAAYYLAIVAGGLGYGYAYPGAGNLEGLVVVFLVLVYPAVWAFIIRRALAVRVYRNQALAIGLFPLAFLFGLATGVLGLSVFVLFAFYLIDSSALAGRRSDPLLRDTLHWSRLRTPLWALLLAITLVQVADLLSRGTVLTNREPNDIIGNIGFLATVLLIAVSVAEVSLVAFRSRDPALRKNLGWFGVALIATLLSPLLAANVPYMLGAAVGFVLLGYFLYKSVRSLVPINPLPLDLLPTGAMNASSRHTFTRGVAARGI